MTLTNRTQESLDKGVKEMSEIYKSYDKVGIKDRSMIWNSYVIFSTMASATSTITAADVPVTWSRP